MIDNVNLSAMEFAQNLKADDYAKAIRIIHAHGRRMAAFHERYQVIVSPTLANPPVPLGPQHTNNPDMRDYTQAITTFAPFTSPFNMSGHRACRFRSTGRRTHCLSES
jgi:amidase